MKIYAIILVQDESDVLDSVLRDAERFCDQVFVYDTGSVDGSMEIVRQREGRGVEVIHSASVLFHEQQTRRHALSLIKDRLKVGDWLVWLDADEFIGLEVDDFRRFLHDSIAGIIRHRHYNFGITIQQLQSQPALYMDEKFKRSAYSHYREFAYLEVKCLRWEKGLFDCMMGGRDLICAKVSAQQRLPVLHYPYRSLRQMAMRLVLRNIIMHKHEAEKFNRHWRVDRLESFLLDETSPNVRVRGPETVAADFLRADGHYDSRWSWQQRAAAKLRQSVLKLPVIRERVVHKRRVTHRQQMYAFSPVPKPVGFDNDLRRAYDAIDVSRILRELNRL